MSKKFTKNSNYKFLSALSLIGLGICLMKQTTTALVRPFTLLTPPSPQKTKFFCGNNGVRIPIYEPTDTTHNRITSPSVPSPSNPKKYVPNKYFYKNGIKIPIFETSKITSSPIKNQSKIEIKNDDINKSYTSKTNTIPSPKTHPTIKLSTKYRKLIEEAEVMVNKISSDLKDLEKQTSITNKNETGIKNLKDDLFTATKVTVIPVPDKKNQVNIVQNYKQYLNNK